MSYNVTSRIRLRLAQLRRPHFTSSHLAVLLALADRAKDDGVCWPGIETLANDAWLSPRCVRTVIADLERNGLLEVTRTSGRGNRYRLTLDHGTEDLAGGDNGISDHGRQHLAPRLSEPSPGVGSTLHPGSEYPLTSKEQIKDPIKKTVQAVSVSSASVSVSVQQQVAIAPVTVTASEPGENAIQLTDCLFQLLGSPAHVENDIRRKWEEQAEKALLLVPNIECLMQALQWVFSANDNGDQKKNPATFWFNRITEATWPMAHLAKSADKIVQAAAIGSSRKQKSNARSTTPATAPGRKDFYTLQMMQNTN